MEFSSIKDDKKISDIFLNDFYNSLNDNVIEKVHQYIISCKRTYLKKIPTINDNIDMMDSLYYANLVLASIKNLKPFILSYDWTKK